MELSGCSGMLGGGGGGGHLISNMYKVLMNHHMADLPCGRVN